MLSASETPDPAEPARTNPLERRVIERVRSGRPGTQVLRVRRPRFEGFSRRGGRLEAGEELERPSGPFGGLRRFLIGAPIRSDLETHERLSKKKALAIFSSDALSSVAYTPQETLIVLLAAGTGALVWSLPISIAVVVLLATVITSYRQTIGAYATGGGSYIVASRNLGELPGLVAAAALMVGYVLTVAVSVASAVDQLTSAVTPLVEWKFPLAVAAIALVTLGNLRGIRESGSIFATPTYVFVASMYLLIGYGLYLALTGQLVVDAPADIVHHTAEPLTLFLILRAFATSSAVMTGTEAVADGVMAFRPPEAKNAARTIVVMAVILATMFLGLVVLIQLAHLVPHEGGETVISQLARSVFGLGPIYYLIQASAVVILILAANTAYADFPRLASFLARDGYAPRQLAFRGERLAFTNGILTLGILAIALIAMFGGSVGGLLPLYALTVFTAFTLSQAGMVRHWMRERGSHWSLKAGVNGFGASVTAAVVLIAGTTNFVNPRLPIIEGFPLGWGAWLVMVVIPLVVWIFKRIHRHYQEAAVHTALPTDPAEVVRPLKHVVVVPVAKLNRPTVRAIQYAASLSSHVVAVHVASDPADAESIESRWGAWGQGIPLVIIDSPYRSLTGPLLRFLSELKKSEDADVLTVVVPEYVPDAWWEHFLHGQSAQFLKVALLFKPGYVVTSVPVHERAEPAKTTTAGS